MLRFLSTLGALPPAGTEVTTAGTQTLTNKTLDVTNTVTLKDSLFTLQDDGDVTKQFQLQLSGITTGTTRTITVPDNSGTLVTLTGQTGNFSIAGSITSNDATQPQFVTPAGATNTGFLLLNGKTSGSFKILPADATAQAVTLSIAAQTSGASTLTIPDQAGVSSSFVLTTLAQTLTNKTFTSPAIATPTFSGQQIEGIGGSTAAAGTTTSDAGVLPAGTAAIYPTTAADGTKGVRIHANDKVTGVCLFIGNGVAASTLKVYAPSGGTINGAAADAAFVSASGKGVFITCLSGAGNTWLAA